MEIDFLSLDIDGNDLEVLRHITVLMPRVLCVEYNAKFPPPQKAEIAYDPDHVWRDAECPLVAISRHPEG